MRKSKKTITREEFIRAFKAASAKQTPLFDAFDRMTELMGNKKLADKNKALRETFNRKITRIFSSGAANAKASANKLHTGLLKIATDFGRKDLGRNHAASPYFQIALNTIASVPDLKKEHDRVICRENERAEIRRRKENARFEARINKKETIKERLARLERENADLQQAAGDVEPTKDSWADDNRVGHYRPEPRYVGGRD